MAREWNAVAYEGLSSPQTRWGAVFLDRLELGGDEDAIDAGCGTGKVTALLLEKLPRGTVLAVDGSRAMVEAAGERFAGEPRVRVEHQDLLELTVEEPVDLVFSTATFHWIGDHRRLFDRLAGVLKPGGRLAAQCGGEGNISRATRATREVMGRDRFRGYFEGWDDDKNYAGAGETKERLEAAGFEGVETWLHEELTGFGSVGELTRFLAAVVLGGHLERLPEEEREPFAAAVAGEIVAEDGETLLDYVRLNMMATRSGRTG
ncbi:methyltransferase domain-containing protein [Rubrobacter tropicus]|uniref:Methyltransferase domain-containing protein n=1 Tax=Rubrobacter tropicus TaxID=2653851 RepID=A0A6G8Q4C8_9ACTN|nr:methyltransferase domain-containing protein [Rubrobacter tropicus]QIN81298.1 methyltransferase domain-containing protein [Rubrobacter tropicus]